VGLHEFAVLEAFPEFWFIGFDAGAGFFCTEADFRLTVAEIFQAEVTMSGEPLEVFDTHVFQDGGVFWIGCEVAKLVWVGGKVIEFFLRFGVLKKDHFLS